MTVPLPAEPTLEFLPEPGFVLRRNGDILGANTPARRLLGADLIGGNILDRIAGPHQDFEDFLRRAARSTSPLVGSASFVLDAGPEQFRVYGARLLGSAEGEPRLVVHCRAVSDDHFALLSRRVRDLDVELRKRLKEKATLEESLRQNQTLLRELQHRVKNNIQLMMSLIRMSAKGGEKREPSEIVDAASLRLQALASTQEAIYRSATAGSLSAKPFLEDLVAGIAASSGFADAVELAIEDAVLASDEAHCLALIVNELVTNAGKHGLRNGEGRIRVSFDAAGDDLRLVVQDDGPGLAVGAGTRSSGLQLVRGLCRQIGGRFEAQNEGGTRCSVHFGSRLAVDEAR